MNPSEVKAIAEKIALEVNAGKKVVKLKALPEVANGTKPSSIAKAYFKQASDSHKKFTDTVSRFKLYPAGGFFLS